MTNGTTPPGSTPANDAQSAARIAISNLRNIPLDQVPQKDVDKVAKALQEAYTGDIQFYRAAIYFLFVVTILVVLSVFALIWTDKTEFDGLIAIGSVAIGAIAGLFAKK